MVRSHCRLNLEIPKVNQVSFGNKSIRSFGPKIWNFLPAHIKSCENLETFKSYKKLGRHSVEYAKTTHLRCYRQQINFKYKNTPDRAHFTSLLPVYSAGEAWHCSISMASLRKNSRNFQVPFGSFLATGICLGILGILGICFMFLQPLCKYK